MSDNLVIEHLRAMRSEFQTLRTEMHAEFSDVKHRLSAVELALAGVRRDGAESADGAARMQGAIDALSARVLRIERQLEHTPE